MRLGSAVGSAAGSVASSAEGTAGSAASTTAGIAVIYLDRILFGVGGWSQSALAVDLLIFLAAWSGFQGFGAPRAPVLYLI